MSNEIIYKEKITKNTKLIIKTLSSSLRINVWINGTELVEPN